MYIEVLVPEEWTPGQAFAVSQLLQHGVRTGQPVIAFLRKDVSSEQLKEFYERVNTMISEAGLEPT
jgi:hypothetical protein